jgi:hypothetical protein
VLWLPHTFQAMVQLLAEVGNCWIQDMAPVPEFFEAILCACIAWKINDIL